MGRVERDIGNSSEMLQNLNDQILMENRMLTRLNEILDLPKRVDDHDRRLERLEQTL